MERRESGKRRPEVVASLNAALAMSPFLANGQADPACRLKACTKLSGWGSKTTGPQGLRIWR